MRKCRNCKYFYTEAAISSCRAGPPRIIVDIEKDRALTTFPQPSPLAWCGFHRFAWWRILRAVIARNGS